MEVFDLSVGTWWCYAPRCEETSDSFLVRGSKTITATTTTLPATLQRLRFYAMAWHSNSSNWSLRFLLLGQQCKSMACDGYRSEKVFIEAEHKASLSVVAIYMFLSADLPKSETKECKIYDPCIVPYQKDLSFWCFRIPLFTSTNYFAS